MSQHDAAPQALRATKRRGAPAAPVDDALLLGKLVQATLDDHPDKAREALADGADPFARHGDGKPSMMLAAELGLTKILGYSDCLVDLISRKWDMSLKNRGNRGRAKRARGIARSLGCGPTRPPAQGDF